MRESAQFFLMRIRARRRQSLADSNKKITNNAFFSVRGSDNATSVLYLCTTFFQYTDMAKRIVILLCAALLSASDLQAQTVQQWRDSLATLNQQIRRFPKSTDLRLRKAAVNIELNQWDYAIEEYSAVLQIDPLNLAALYFRAYANSYLRHYDLAKFDYERFLSIMPRNFNAQLGLAMVKRKMGRKVDAMDEMNKLVQMYPDSALAYVARAGYEAEVQQYEAALYDWDEAIKRSPRNADFVASKVEVLLTIKRNDEAVYELESAIKRGIPRAALKEWFDKCK